MAESKYLNQIPIDHQVQTREGIPSDYHCTCDYCKNFMGEIFNNDEGKHYSNRIRKSYYVDEAGDHLDAGHIIGYRWAIQNLCPEGGTVLDPTVGTGTAIVEAINNGRNAIGIELEYPEVAEKNIVAQIERAGGTIDPQSYFRQGNALKIDEYLDEWGIPKNSIDLIINGTPYPRLSSKSSDAPERKNLKTGEDKSFDYNHEENIGITKGDEYWNLVRTMYTKSIQYLKPGGYFVILIKDMVQNKEPYLLHKQITDVVLESNPEMEHYGFFLHSHSPTTMFQNTYGKRFSDVQIPWYQVGIVLRKKGKDPLLPGFPVDKSGIVRDVPYKLHEMDSEYTVSYRDPAGEVNWKKNGFACAPPDMSAKKPKKKVKDPSKKETIEIPYESSDFTDYKKEVDLSQFKSPGITTTDGKTIVPVLEGIDFRNGSDLEFKDLDHELYRVYEFSDYRIKIEQPLKIHISDSGGHRIWDSEGISHYIPAGWKHLYWFVKEGKPHFDF